MKRIIVTILMVGVFMASHAKTHYDIKLRDVVLEYNQPWVSFFLNSEFSSYDYSRAENELNELLTETYGIQGAYAYVEAAEGMPGKSWIDINLSDNNYGSTNKTFDIKCHLFYFTITLKGMELKDPNLSQSGSIAEANAKLIYTRQAYVSYLLYRDNVLIRDIPYYDRNPNPVTIPITEDGTYTLEAYVLDHHSYVTPEPIAQGPVSFPGSVSFYDHLTPSGGTISGADKYYQGVTQTVAVIGTCPPSGGPAAGEFTYAWEERVGSGWEVIPGQNSENCTLDVTGRSKDISVRRKAIKAGRAAYSNVHKINRKTTTAVYNNLNTITKNTYTTADASSRMQSLEYINGLGRSIQHVQVGATPTHADLVTLKEYDSFGRESNNWLPVPVVQNNGGFVPIHTYINAASDTYAGDLAPYSKTFYESSPLNRVEQQFGPGVAWYNHSGSVKTAYMTNVAENDSLNCTYYTVSDPDNQTVRITKVGNYANNELYVTRMEDEDGGVEFHFKDKLDNLVLVRQLIDGGSTKTYADTYYIYDAFKNLRVVLPPLASDELTSTSSWNSTSTASLSNYAYLYKYDTRNRCIAKKLPGAEWIYYVYDKADRLIFTQDGEARAKSEWQFSIPDALGRNVLTGTCKDTLNYADNPLANVVVKATWAGTGDAYKGYNISGIGLSSPVKILSAEYYDSYDFLALPGFTTLGYTTPESGFGTCYTESYKSLLTGTYLAEAGGGSEEICSALYYDYRGRMIQSQVTNHLAGKDSEYIGYNFTGQPLKTKTVHTAPGKTTQTEYYTYTYDHAGRPTKTEHQQGSSTATKTVLVANTYDELGRLKTQKKGSLPASTYTYNVRSWMKSITGTLFSETLYYNDSYAGNTPRYNGNISAMSWRANSETLRGYRFAYDGLSRITKADYLLNGSPNDNYKVPSIAYDKHGNITALQRWGKTSSGYGIVDNLTLGYTGNQLAYVTDAAVKTPDVTIGLNDFKDASALTSGEYAYNRNGAMSKDLNKGISNIAYNSLNLPTQLTINGITNNYTYAADGTKLRVTRGSDVTDYVGNKIYENGSLKRILVDGGYIEDGVYHFYIQDHQGNIRVVATGTGTVVQRNHYYPFGMPFGEVAASEQDKQPYKFGGKELDRKNGLNLYDYSARYMEPALGRFTTMDPLAEKYYGVSPYAYCAGNPVRYVDPTGMVYGDPPGFWELFSIGFVKPFEDFGKLVSHPISTVQGVAEAVGESTPLELAVGIGEQALRMNPASSGFLNQMDVVQAVAQDQANGTFTSAEVIGNQWGNIAFDGVSAAIGGAGAKVAGFLGKGTTAASRATLPNIKVGGGAALENISGGEALRIQNVATRINKPVVLVGSRAAGTASPISDWDYIIRGGLKNSREWSKIKNSLPGAKSVMDNTPRNIDIHNTLLQTDKPFIMFHPQ